MAFDYGFLILSPDRNIARVKNTLASIDLYFGKIPKVCVIGNNADAGDLKEFNKMCPTYQGSGHQSTSLINAGMKHFENRWAIILTEGVWLNGYIDRKLSTFAKSELDILFPIFAQYDLAGKPFRLVLDFVSAPLNGLTIHPSTFHDVGDFTDNPPKIAKQLWYDKAVKLGIAFKGVLGLRIC